MRSVVICGSRRFKPEIRKLEASLKKAGVTVWAPYLHSPDPNDWVKLQEQQQKFILLGLTLDHFYKIRMADVVYVYNKGGYSGVSTSMEIGCAAALGKPIYSLEEDKEEGCRNVLFRAQLKTPKQLLAYLK
ncbi:MAG: hypothetical protein A3F61_03570 [Candidatus Blackburnbacteria bacterium RIFCSPHIGHO2_12_FULL_41_13b]|uniref:MazG nucleotide pyrophosphohydrolase n=1 Tax=Candidatus Blackburnbacteria bacterium RIFCSPHIGHO2_12_FULL_41_13b TaxID=1797517 RepID=A0A1G1V8I2_9BACT|nr:MAG: hypothetical protein A3F61_03570 [Candidatus Blackburnbacteria bacterium RIFCSPHIGHO2_12_FULL_41_13b]